MFEDGLVTPGTYCVMCKSRTTDVLKTVLNFFHKRSEVGDVEIKNIVRL